MANRIIKPTFYRDRRGGNYMDLGAIIKSLVDYVFNNYSESYENAHPDWLVKSIQSKNGYIAIEFADKEMGIVYLDGFGVAYPNKNDEPDYAERIKYIKWNARRKEET